MVWGARRLYDDWVRYEDLVADPNTTLGRVVDALGLDQVPPIEWDPGEVPGAMFKSERHQALAHGRITEDRVGLWRRHDPRPSAAAHALAREMGYSE
jgi:hypothetical protein